MKNELTAEKYLPNFSEIHQKGIAVAKRLKSSIKKKVKRTVLKKISRLAIKRRKPSKIGKITKAAKLKKWKPLAKFNPTPRSAAEIKAAFAAGGGVGSSCPCGDEIKRDGNPITSANNTALIGQQINLSIGCSDFTLTDISWSIPDIAFKNYSMNTSTGGPVVTLSSGDLSATSISFYFFTPGSKSITLTFKANGISCTKSTSLTISAPTVVNKAILMGDVAVGVEPGGNPGVGLFNAPTTPPKPQIGILFAAQVTVPTGFANGSWGFVQLISRTNCVVKKLLAPPTCVQTANVTNALDTNVFIQTVPPDPTPPWSTDGTTYGASDTPNIETNGLISAKENVSFKDYLMFLPPGTNSVWVPLQKTSWGFSFCASLGPWPGWAIINSSRTPTSGNPSFTSASALSDFPTWTTNVAPPSFSPLNPCPDPFCS